MSMKVENVTIDFGDTLAEKWRTEEEQKQLDFARNERMWELYKGYKQCKTYAGKQEYILEHATINKSKYFSMSKRRQKLFLDGQFGMYYHKGTEKLVPMYRRFGKDILLVNTIFRYEEPVGKAFTKMMETWASILVGENG